MSENYNGKRDRKYIQSSSSDSILSAMDQEVRQGHVLFFFSHSTMQLEWYTCKHGNRLASDPIDISSKQTAHTIPDPSIVTSPSFSMYSMLAPRASTFEASSCPFANSTMIKASLSSPIKKSKGIREAGDDDSWALSIFLSLAIKP